MWKTVKLSEICEIQPPKKEVKNILEDDSKVSFMGMDLLGIDKMHANPEEVRSLSSVYKGYTYFAENDVLLAKITPCFENGKLGVARGLKNGVGFGSSEFVVFRCKENILPNFLYYFLNQKSFREEGKKNMSGAVGHKRVTKEFIANSLISLPPLAEQQRIVAKLDAAFAEIDTAIEAVAKSVDDVSRLLESKITDYLSNQNCSRTLTLKDVCEATQGVQIAKSNQSGEKLDGYARYLYISDFSHDKNIKYVKNDYPKKTVFPTDIIVVNTGASAGKIFKGIPGILSNNLFKVSPVEALINGDFLYLFVNSLIFKKYQAQIMRGTANPHMGHQNFLSTPIQLPEISAQREIVEMVSCLLRHGETIQNAYIKKKISLSSLKAAILGQELQSEAA